MRKVKIVLITKFKNIAYCWMDGNVYIPQYALKNTNWTLIWRIVLK